MVQTFNYIRDKFLEKLTLLDGLCLTICCLKRWFNGSKSELSDKKTHESSVLSIVRWTLFDKDISLNHANHVEPLLSGQCFTNCEITRNPKMTNLDTKRRFKKVDFIGG